MHRPLAGIRVFVVEDDRMLAELITELLADQQCEVIGPFYHIEPALEAAHSADIDIGLLDINVGGVVVYPVAEVLHARGKPLLFLSGLGEDAVSAQRAEWRVCAKPFRMHVLVNMMLEALLKR